MNFPDFIPLFLSYAEIHYHLKYLFPRYYTKEPEIIADIPLRIVKSRASSIPVLIIVKDADKFPVFLKKIVVEVRGEDDQSTNYFKIDKKLEDRFFSEIFDFELDRFKAEQFLQVLVRIEIEIDGNAKTIFNDNFPDIDLPYFRTYFSEKGLPKPESWFAGEPHYHSIYTSDQVEFGADIKSSRKMAETIGLDWLFITDHSYDLDDDENDCTKNDPDIPKWYKMKADAKDNDTEKCRVIFGEEASIGTAKGKNVHLLLINNETFIHGSGDSAEKWFKNKPTHSLSELNNPISLDTNSLAIAAHPFEKIPFMQKISLRRGNWLEADFSDNDIEFLQVVNSAVKKEVINSIDRWKNLLLKGHKLFILAGNDAHGNFNVMRQIKSPFWKLFYSHKQIFGKFFTLFKFSKNDPVSGIKSKEMIVSNGPFINFWLEADGRKFPIGSVANCEKATFHFESGTSNEFGEIIEEKLYAGFDGFEQKLVFDNGKEIDLSSIKYLRMSLKTKNSGMAFTNPIFVE